nr:MAG TPA: hypothetical protein [Caudoviricetes sp.]
MLSLRPSFMQQLLDAWLQELQYELQVLQSFHHMPTLKQNQILV